MTKSGPFPATISRPYSDYLGDKKYFFGDVATTIDCTLFGHLAQFLYIPLDFPQKSYMNSKCPTLVAYVGRFKEQYWKDWDNYIMASR